MLVPLNWLKQYVEIDISPERLGELLTMCGLELEAIHSRGKGIENVVVAKVLEVNDHPNADRLSVCKVIDGTDTYNVVCGADNVRPDAYVALAKVGAKLPPTEKFPNGLEIKETKIRGESSEGMLCSESEIGLSNDSEGIIILSDDLPLGSSLVDEMSLDEVVLDLSITPNRPDCLSIFGIAREVSSILKPLKNAKFSSNEILEKRKNPLPVVKIKNDLACPRYSCRVIENVTVAPSPNWLKNRLQAVGIRSINNIVDITNFVMLEIGQPLHAFDHDLLEKKIINVRLAQNREILVTLDKQEVELAENDLLICDGDTPIALGGVMGGLNTEVSNKTVNILLEAAYFDPVTIRKTSKRTGIRSEASYRFERGVDPNNTCLALERASYLIAELAGGTLGTVVDVYPSPIQPKKINVSVEKVKNILGINITSGEIVNMLLPLEFRAIETCDTKVFLQIPTFRVDVTRDIDVIEEIGRLFGYDNVPMDLPAVGILTSEIDQRSDFISNLKRTFIYSGFFEAINYGFENPSLLRMFNSSNTLHILNPLTSEGSAMRTSIIPGLIRSMKTNLARQITNVRLFEHGKIFLPQEKGELPKEEMRFSAVATGKMGSGVWSTEDFGFFDLKNILIQGISSVSHGKKPLFIKSDEIGNFLHPSKSAAVFIDDTKIGVIGELHPDHSDKLEIDKEVYLLDINLDNLTDFYGSCSYDFKSVPKFPSIRRDISFIVGRDVTAGQIIDNIRKVSELVEDADVFDVFEGGRFGKDKKSVGISIVIRSHNKTLTDEDANMVQNLAIKELNSSLGAEIRST